MPPLLNPLRSAYKSLKRAFRLVSKFETRSSLYYAAAHYKEGGRQFKLPRPRGTPASSWSRTRASRPMTGERSLVSRARTPFAPPRWRTASGRVSTGWNANQFRNVTWKVKREASPEEVAPTTSVGPRRELAAPPADLVAIVDERAEEPVFVPWIVVRTRVGAMWQPWDAVPERVRAGGYRSGDVLSALRARAVFLDGN